jgi:GT2 family glycosyltransferase
MTNEAAVPQGPRVSVIVPVFNRRETTRAFLSAFRSVRYEPREIVVVDDGSTDGTGAMVEKEFPEARLVHTPGDCWWAHSMNIGLEDALGRTPDYVLSINDDVLMAPDFLGALVAYAERHPRTLVGSCIYHASRPEDLWYAGGRVALLRGELVHRQRVGGGAVAWLTGMGTLIPTAVFSEVGMYDAACFPQYIADADLSMRARIRGFDLAIEPAARLWNQTDASGHVQLRKRVTLSTFLLPFRSLHSAYAVRARVALYRRHWPALLVPVAVAVYVLRVLRKQTIRLLGISRPLAAGQATEAAGT